ncbi:hypothetical protein R3P38DRAFT_3206590 [Favolaschia claudopus]|uniref:Uncharacterized protein n=1 Tax=Favolaschia claudopus TaxID=2862362 RepID=A0AAW0APM0_9AGAR
MASVSVSHNPFRTPAATPNTTGIAPQQYAPPTSPPPSTSPSTPANNSQQQQQYAPPPQPPPLTDVADPIGLSEDAPPAYTTRADVYQGESTLEYGPTRPFQPQTVPPLPHQQHPQQQQQHAGWVPQTQTQQPSLWSQIAAQLTGASTSSSSASGFPPSHWSSAYPGRQQQHPHPPPPHPPPNSSFPPPQQQYPYPSQAPPPSTTSSSHISEFARDFYGTTSVPPGAFSDVSGMRGAGSGMGTGYPPPPPRHPSQSQSQYQAPSGGPPSSSGFDGGDGRNGEREGAGAGAPPDDGRPTTTPTAGHPLLLNGNMLVYPKGHECYKCNNTGYKNNDPLRPCHRCWDRYARPYAGAVTYAPSSSSTTTGRSSATNTTFQRPLPHLNGYRPSHPQSHSHSSSAPTFSSGYPGSSSSFAPPPPSNSHLYPPPNLYPPPPVGTVLRPGDPRLGGAPCWRCGGRGTVSGRGFLDRMVEVLDGERVGCASSVERGGDRVGEGEEWEMEALVRGRGEEGWGGLERGEAVDTRTGAPPCLHVWILDKSQSKYPPSFSSSNTYAPPRPPRGIPPLLICAPNVYPPFARRIPTVLFASASTLLLHLILFSREYPPSSHPLVSSHSSFCSRRILAVDSSSSLHPVPSVPCFRRERTYPPFSDEDVPPPEELPSFHPFLSSSFVRRLSTYSSPPFVRRSRIHIIPTRTRTLRPTPSSEREHPPTAEERDGRAWGGGGADNVVERRGMRETQDATEEWVTEEGGGRSGST